MFESCVLLLCVFLSFTKGQPTLDDACPCDADPHSLSSQWESWVGVTTCSGGCGSTVLSGFSDCAVVTHDRVVIYRLTCERNEVDGCDLCPSRWGEWGNLGQCGVECGFGEQRQSRTCYQLNSVPPNVQSDRCAGAVGTIHQYRNRTCSRHCTVPRLTTRMRTRAPVTNSNTTQASTTTTTTSTSLIEDMSSSTTTKMPETPKSLPPSFILPPRHPSEGFDTVALAAALGAVAIICVTIVAVAVAVVLLKQKQSFKQTASYSTANGGTIVTNLSQLRRQDGNYAQKVSKTGKNKLNYYPQTGNRGLYEASLLEDGILQAPNESVPNQHNANKDDVYFSIEEKER